jgi:hypothetical protein
MERIYNHIKDLEKELVVTKKDYLQLAEEVYILKKEFKGFLLGLDYPTDSSDDEDDSKK